MRRPDTGPASGSTRCRIDRSAIERLYPVFREPLGSRNESFLQQMNVAAVPAGATLFDERSPCLGFPLLLEGGIRVVKSGGNGRELLLYQLSPGDSCIISSSCLLGGIDYNARGIAEIDSRLAVLPRSVFEELIQEPVFRRFVFEAFSARIGNLMQLIEEVTFHRLDQRLARLLLGRGPLVHTTHQQLADELGSVREIVSRLLKGFAQQAFIRLGREQIEILDAAGLRRMAS